MDGLCHESQRWLEDVLPVGRSINPFVCHNENSIKILRNYVQESSSLNGTCFEALEKIGQDFDRYNKELEIKLQSIFGSFALNSAFSESNLPELEWLLTVATVSKSMTADDSRIRHCLVHLDEEITKKQIVLSNLKSNYDRLQRIQSELSDKKSELLKAAQKIDISIESQKAKMSENMKTLSKLSQKKKQYEKSSMKLESELSKHSVETSFSSSLLFEQQSRIDQLKQRAVTLEDALRHYCGLSTDKYEAQRQLKDLADELSKIDMKFIEKIRDQ